MEVGRWFPSHDIRGKLAAWRISRPNLISSLPYLQISHCISPHRSVAAPLTTQGVPRNTLTWKKSWIFFNFFFISSVLGTPSITKLGTPSITELETPSNYKKKKKKCNRAHGKPNVANPRILPKKKKKNTEQRLSPKGLNQKTLKYFISTPYFRNH